MVREPQYIYSYNTRRNQITRTHFSTDEDTTLSVRLNKFDQESCWTELPGDNLVFTGGRLHPYQAVNVGLNRELAVTHLPNMSVPRVNHSILYHNRYLYVVGELKDPACERYSIDKAEWQLLPNLPIPCTGISLIALEQTMCLYAIGGYRQKIGSIQKLRLKDLVWEILAFPTHQFLNDFMLPVFKIDESRAYFISNKTLFCFDPASVSISPVKQLAKSISRSNGTCCYSRGILFISGDHKTARQFKLEF